MNSYSESYTPEEPRTPEEEQQYTVALMELYKLNQRIDNTTDNRNSPELHNSAFVSRLNEATIIEQSISSLKKLYKLANEVDNNYETSSLNTNLSPEKAKMKSLASRR